MEESIFGSELLRQEEQRQKDKTASSNLQIRELREKIFNGLKSFSEKEKQQAMHLARHRLGSIFIPSLEVGAEADSEIINCLNIPPDIVRIEKKKIYRQIFLDGKHLNSNAMLRRLAPTIKSFSYDHLESVIHPLRLRDVQNTLSSCKSVRVDLILKLEDWMMIMDVINIVRPILEKCVDVYGVDIGYQFQDKTRIQNHTTLKEKDSMKEYIEKKQVGLVNDIDVMKPSCIRMRSSLEERKWGSLQEIASPSSYEAVNRANCADYYQENYSYGFNRDSEEQEIEQVDLMKELNEQKDNAEDDERQVGDEYGVELEPHEGELQEIVDTRVKQDIDDMMKPNWKRMWWSLAEQKWDSLQEIAISRSNEAENIGNCADYYEENYPYGFNRDSDEQEIEQVDSIKELDIQKDNAKIEVGREYGVELKLHEGELEEVKRKSCFGNENAEEWPAKRCQ